MGSCPCILTCIKKLFFSPERGGDRGGEGGRIIQLGRTDSSVL